MAFMRYFRRKRGNMGAILAGAAAARRNARVGGGVKKKTARATKLASRYRKRTGGSRTIVRRRRRTVKMGGSIEQREISIRQRGNFIPTRQLAMFSMEPQWFRVQGISQFDTSTGFYCISSRRDTTPVPNVQYLPVHVWDLTALPQGGFCPVGYALSQATGPVNNVFELNSTNASGGTVTNSRLIAENTQGSAATIQPWRKSLHDYTHVKANLYGVRRRATKWMVTVMQLTDEFGDFISAATGNTEKAKVYDYLARPLMFNNLNYGDPQTRVDFKIIKKFEVIIDPINTDQVDGALAVPRMVTLNWFIKHNRMRLYDWRRNDTPLLGTDAVFDTENNIVDIRTDPKKRLYLVMQAMSPVNNSGAGVTPISTGANPDTEPSYDLVIRQKHWFSV